MCSDGMHQLCIIVLFTYQSSDGEVKSHGHVANSRSISPAQGPRREWICPRPCWTFQLPSLQINANENRHQKVGKTQEKLSLKGIPAIVACLLGMTICSQLVWYSGREDGIILLGTFVFGTASGWQPPPPVFRSSDQFLPGKLYGCTWREGTVAVAALSTHFKLNFCWTTLICRSYLNICQSSYSEIHDFAHGFLVVLLQWTLLDPEERDRLVTKCIHICSVLLNREHNMFCNFIT